MNKPIKLIVVGVFSTFCVSASAQESLADACFADIELTDYIAGVASGNANVDTSYVPENERTEINAVLNDPALVGASLRDKVQAVLNACAAGTILSSRVGPQSN